MVVSSPAAASRAPRGFEGGKYDPHTQKCLGARRGLGRPDPLVCARRKGHEVTSPQRTDGMAVLRRNPRVRQRGVGATRVSELRKADAEQPQHWRLLEGVPARQLVLLALAPWLSDRLRSRRARCGRKARRARRLGPSLLELLQAEPEQAAPRLRVSVLAGRKRRKSA